MGELLLKKALRLRERIAKLRARLAGLDDAVQAVSADENLEAFLAFNLFLAIQDAVDLAAHVVSARSLTIPASQREVFDALAKAGLIDPAIASAMGALASLRNRIAHTYGDLDLARLVRELPQGLGHLDAFLVALTPALLDQQGS